MDLLREIQRDAVNSQVPIADLLRKCMILASMLQNAELSEWATNELEGYESGDDLPSYRSIEVNSFGHFIGPFRMEYKNFPIPPAAVPEEYRSMISRATLTAPISSLEGTLEAGNGQNLRAPWPPNLTLKLEDQIIEDMSLIDAWREVPLGSAIGIIDTVKSRVLSFVLAIERELKSDNKGLGDLESIPKDVVTQVFYTQVYGNVGSLAQAGNDVQQLNINSVTEGDFATLETYLKSLGIQDKEISKLHQSIRPTLKMHLQKLLDQEYLTGLEKLSGWLQREQSNLVLQSQPS